MFLHRNRTRWTFALILSLFIFISGCGRTLPVIDQQLLSQKKSLLVVVGASISPEATETIAKTASLKAQSEGIAFDILKQVRNLDEKVSSEIKGKRYDAVLVVGESLLSGAVSLAQEQPDKHFILLQDGSAPASLPASLPGNVAFKRIDETRTFAMWNSWVAEQGAAGLNILWVNKTTEPIPAVWAPSEESDHIVSLDLVPEDQWLQQLTLQARTIHANWIVFYSSFDQNIVTKVKTLRIPVIDMGSGLTAAYQWEKIISDRIAAVKTGKGETGVSTYTDEELTVSKK